MTAEEGLPRLLLRPEPLDAATFAPFGAVLAYDDRTARAFLGGRGAAIGYARDRWHDPKVALDEEGDMLMLAFERGPSGVPIEHRLPAAILVAD